MNRIKCILIIALLIIMPSSFSVGGELKIYSSEGVQTLSFPDSDSSKATQEQIPTLRGEIANIIPYDELPEGYTVQVIKKGQQSYVQWWPNPNIPLTSPQAQIAARIAGQPLYMTPYGYSMIPPEQAEQMVPSGTRDVRTGVPPIPQTLIREGYFAVKLAEALRIGRVKSETEAESVLASAGITPKNGWIADYPVTPDVIGELQNAIGSAVDSGKLGMNREEAVKTFQDLAAQQGLPVKVNARQKPIEPQRDYEESEAVDN